MLTVRDVVAQCDIFAGLDPRHLQLIAGCAQLHRLPAGQVVFREGEPADWFYVLREGRVALEVAAPETGAITIETVGPGATLGWSWLFPPYRWQLDAVARDPVSAVRFDGACLRSKCGEDHELGFQLMSRFSHLMLERLIATRHQLLDVYGRGSR